MMRPEQILGEIAVLLCPRRLFDLFLDSANDVVRSAKVRPARSAEA